MFSLRYFLSSFKKIYQCLNCLTELSSRTMTDFYFIISLLSYFTDDFTDIGKTLPQITSLHKTQTTRYLDTIQLCIQKYSAHTLYGKHSEREEKTEAGSVASLQLNPLAFIILSVPNLENSPSPWAFTESSNTFIIMKCDVV